MSLPRVLSAKQLYCPASASSALHSSMMDRKNVTPFSVSSSSKIVIRELLLSTVSSLFQEMDGLGVPWATQTKVMVLPASIAIVWFGRMTIWAGSE